jgi:general secretion pathway protein G
MECRSSVLRATQIAIRTALDMYQVDTGVSPTESQGLKALLTDPGVDGWAGPYLESKDNLPSPDPWGNQFRYTLADGKPKIDSAGADGKFGTEDDNKTQKARTTGCSRTR